MKNVPTRAARFSYLGVHIADSSITASFDLDGTPFNEVVTFSDDVSLDAPGITSIAELWALVAGLSYYKAGAARTIDVGTLGFGPATEDFLLAAIYEGLGEFAFRNELDLTDVSIVGGTEVEPITLDLDEREALVPFGGGIDSMVTVTSLASTLRQTLFVVSPEAGTFDAIEDALAALGLPVTRVSRRLDPAITSHRDDWFNGHVPVTAMVTLLATISAIGRGSANVVMSNEHSASVPNLTWNGLDINHQWSKSASAEVLLADALAERLDRGPVVASFLRDKSELWVARELSRHDELIGVVRSCNRAFRQDPSLRARTWCGECDKCLFISLVLSPFIPRERITDIFGGTHPLTREDYAEEIRTLVGLGVNKKPFECVGDPDECAVALHSVVSLEAYKNCDHLHAIAREASDDQTLDDLLEPQGGSRVPASWLQ